MAAQLSKERIRAMFAPGAPPLRVPLQALAAVAAICAIVAIASLIAAAHNARQQQADAQQRFADLQALLSVPPGSSDALQQEVDSLNLQVALGAGLLAPSKVDPSSDAATSLLVRTAQAAGLTVKGITRVTDAPATLDTVAYTVQGIQVVADGSMQQMINYLSDMGGAEPALIPRLTTLTISDNGAAHAQITFNVYTKVASPTPPPVPAGTPRAKR